MTDTSNVFSDYLKSREGYGNQVGFRPTFTPGSGIPGSGTNRGWLANFVDFLNIGVYPGTNLANEFLMMPERREEIQAKAAQGRTGEAIGDSIKMVGGLVTAVPRGLAAPFMRAFGAELPEGSGETWDKVIERGVDVSNRNNPNYIDTANNANPILKGGLGLAADIALDPLTWLSLGTLGAAKTFARGAGAVTTATKAAKTAEEIIELGNKVPTSKPVTPSEAIARGLPEAAATPTMAGARTLDLPTSGSFQVGKQVPSADNFPSSTVTEQIIKNVENAPVNSKSVDDAVNEIMAKTIDNKLVDVPGVGKAPLVGGLKSFFETLKRPVPVAGSAGKIVENFGSYINMLRNDVAETGGNVRIEQVLRSYRPAPIQGAAADIAPTISGMLKQYDEVRKLDTPSARAIREAIETRILLPMQRGYNGATRAGHNVTAFGTPKTASAVVEMAESASVAETVLRNLQLLDEGSKARGIALLGEDYFNAISNLQANQMSKFLDDIGIILQRDGALGDISPLLQNDMGSQFLKLFDIDNAIYAAAKTDVADRFAKAAQGVRQTNLEEALSKIDEEPGVTEDVAELLALFGMVPGRFGFLGDSANAGKVFDITMDFVDAGSDASKINFSAKRLKEEGYDFLTPEGAFRTEDIFGEGFGARLGILNSYGQMNFIVAGATKLNKQFDTVPFLKELKGKGFAQASAKEAISLAAIKTFENAMEVKGVPFVMDLVLTRGGAKITRNLKFSQLYTTLAEQARVPMRLVMFQAGSGMAYTKLMDATMTALLTGDRAEVLKVLQSVETLYKKQPPNWLAKPNNTFTISGVGTYRAGDIAEQIADAIMTSIPKLEDLAELNARAYRARGLAEGEAISSQAAEIVLRMLDDPTKVAQAGIAVAKAGEVVKDIAQTVGNVSDLGVVMGNARLVLGLGEDFKVSAETMLAVVQQVLKRNPEGIAKAQEAAYRQAERIYENAERAAYKSLEDVLNGQARVTGPGMQKLVDETLGEAIDSGLNPMRAVVNGAYARSKAAYVKAWDYGNKFFNVNRGMGVENNLYVKQMYSGVENIQERLAAEILLPVAQIGQKYKGFVDEARTETILQAAYNAIREGRQATGVVEEARQALLPFFGKYFNLDGNIANATMGNMLIRQGVSLERLNEILSMRRVLETTSGKVARTPDEYYDLGKVFEELGPNAKPEDILNALSEQWKSWDIQDPVNFLDKYTRAVSQVIGEATYVNTFRAESIALGLASTTPKAGYIKIGPGDGPTLNKHMQEDLWVDPEVAEIFVNISNHIDEMGSITGSKIASQIDEFTDAWKYAVTQARLGHHMRNLAGGLSMTGAGAGAKHYGEAFVKALEVRKMVQGSSDEVNIIALLDRLSVGSRATVNNLPEAQRVLHSGSKGKITMGEMADAIQRYGINPQVRQAEAFASMGGAEGRVGRWSQKFLSGVSFGIAARGGGMERMWSRISMWQDHVNRDHMFIQLVMQALDGRKMPRGIGKMVKFDFKKPDVMEDIYTYAAERVLKYHPTGQILTTWEKRIPRRLFPFYAWNKGALMALTEATIMYPGRVNWPFKASYNLAVATGVDPNSFYDPFPTDQKFPSFMTEDINGPQFVVNGNYYGIQPGLAQFDVFNQFGGSEDIFNPGWEAFASSLNPAVKIPIELITRSRMQTGNPIVDLSDYVDSSIPNVGYLANWTTYSPSSLIIDGQLEQQKKYESGDKTNLDRVFSMLGWATGMAPRRYSRPDLERLAKIEESVRFAEERERENR